MRLSSGISISFGSDYLGPAVMIEGNSDLSVLTKTDSWKTKSNIEESETRYWRLAQGEDLERTSNQCPAAYLDVLLNVIDNISTEDLHPALSQGLGQEAKRLVPRISAEVNEQYKAFVQSLDAEFGFNLESTKSQPMLPFVDDLGPYLLTLIDGKPAILPEIPPVYLAPESWRLSMWRVNNHMMGPLLAEELDDNQQIQLGGLTIPTDELTPELKGLSYFHMARFVLFFEAWQGDPETPSLKKFLELFSNGIRPLDTVLH